MNALSELILKWRIRIALFFDNLYLVFFAKRRNPPEPIDIPKVFGEFVADFGGELSDEIHANSAQQPENADYIFRDDNVVAELKCLEDDPLSFKNYTRLNQTLLRAGMVQREIALWAAGMIPLPPKGGLALIQQFRKHIQRIARKANRQINSSKTNQQLPTASGVLLIANDNNYLFSAWYKFVLISDVMAHHHASSSITAFVFFSPNVPTRIPGSLRDHHPWMPSYQEGAADSLQHFINRLGHEWWIYSTKDEYSPNIKIPHRSVGDWFLSSGKNIRR